MDVLEFPFQSSELKKIQEEVRLLSKTSVPTLIIGDQGTGKTTWAQALSRSHGVAHIIESHDVPRTVKGWSDLGNNWDRSPVVLENIEKWSESAQSSFALYYKENKNKLRKIIATSSSRLFKKVRQGQFRSDVFYAIAIRQIELPKLNDCTSDFSQIVSFWCEVNGLMYGYPKVKMSEEALCKLKSHRWSGNFAELISVIERSLSLSTQGLILEQHICFDDWSCESDQLEAGLTLAEVEKKLILQTLNLTAQNKSQAARVLGISIRTLRNKLNEYKQEIAHELI